MSVPETVKRFLASFKKDISALKVNEFNQGTIEQKSEQEEASLLKLMKDELGENNAHADEYLMMFLRARKYNVEVAARSFAEYHEYLDKQGLNNPDYGKVEELLRSGLFAYLDSNDKQGRKVLITRICKFDPKFEIEVFIQTIIVLMHEMLKTKEAQLNGIVLLEDLRNMNILAMDSKMGGKLMETLQNKFPCRFGGTVTFRGPLYVRTIVKLILPFLTKKLQSRFHYAADEEQLLQYFDKDQLPVDLGGQLTFDIDTFVDKLLSEHKQKHGRAT